MAFGISGACRSSELLNIKLDDIEDLNSALLVRIPDTKTKVPRSFTLTGCFYDIYKKYARLRPPNIDHQRFFLNYQNSKCTKQVVGINKFGSMPKEIASFLKLPNPQLYTGHSFRRTSATMLVDAGGDLLTLKRHGGWRSSTVAEGYIEDSVTSKMEIAQKIMNSVEPNASQTALPSTSTAITIKETVLDQTPGIIIQNCSNFTINYHSK